MPSSFCTICPQYGKGFVPCCATLRGLVSTGSAGCSCTGAGDFSAAGAGCGGVCCTAGAGSSTTAGVWGAAAAGADCTGALAKGCTAAAKGRGASGCAARAGAACTVTVCICWGGSDRLNSASSSSMRWSLPRVMCSSAVPNVRMARMASRCPISGPFCRYSASSSGETPDSSACPPGSAASIRAR